VKKTSTDRGWDEYEKVFANDKKRTAKINALIKDIDRHPFTGLGKPEPLKNELSGWWVPPDQRRRPLGVPGRGYGRGTAHGYSLMRISLRPIERKGTRTPFEGQPRAKGPASEGRGNGFRVGGGVFA